MEIILQNLNTAFLRPNYTEKKKNAVRRCAADFDKLSESLALASDILKISLQNSCRILSQIIQGGHIALLTESDNNETTSVKIGPVVEQIITSQMTVPTKDLVLGLLFGQLYTFLDTVNKLLMDSTQNAINLKHNLKSYHDSLTQITAINLDDTNGDENGETALVQRFRALSTEDQARALEAVE